MQRHLKRLNSAFAPGDTAWHCLYPSMKPEQGMLAAHYVKPDHDRLMKDAHPVATCFVPFREGTSRPDWQRAVPVMPKSSVTATETECNRAWNDGVRAAIAHEDTRHANEDARHLKRLTQLEAILLPEEDPETT